MSGPRNMATLQLHSLLWYDHSLAVATDSNGTHKEKKGTQEAQVSCQYMYAMVV